MEERGRRDADVDKRAERWTGQTFPAEQRTLSFHGAVMVIWRITSFLGCTLTGCGSVLKKLNTSLIHLLNPNVIHGSLLMKKSEEMRDLFASEFNESRNRTGDAQALQ